MVDSFIFSSLISATDPVGILATFKHIPINELYLPTS